MTPFHRPLVLASLSALVFAACAPRAQVREPLPAAMAVRGKAFEQTIGAVLSFGFVAGNRIETLENGAEIFPAMLAAIRGARSTVDFESFVFEHGEVPEAFVRAFIERARAGVKVNLVLDAVGAAKARRYFGEMRGAGVEVRIYHSLLWPDVRRANHRTHRKLLIVDGRIGFIGGVGIAEAWAGDARTPDEWHDLHYRVTGPIVAQLQGAFHENWLRCGGGVLQGAGYFPALPATGSAKASVFFSSPRHARTQVELMYHLAIASAQRSLLIENAYFLPDRALVDALCQAARRGVKVRLLVPGEHNDQKAVRRAQKKLWPCLLESGVEIWEYEPTMTHTKLLIADGLFVSIGSANFDSRSLRINAEANLNVMDPAFAAEQTRIFQRDLRRSRRLEPDGPVRRMSELPAQTVQAPLEPQL